MQSSEVLFICFSAFISVFLILTSLAIVMQVIMKLFPIKEKAEDLAVFSVMASVLSAKFPGKKITNIKEVK